MTTTIKTTNTTTATTTTATTTTATTHPARVHLTRTGRTPVVCCHGDLDVPAIADLRGVLHDAQAGRPTQNLLVDTRAVTWAGSAALGVLIAAHRRARVEGARLSLVNPPPHLVRSLRVTGLHRVLHVAARSTPPRVCHRAEPAA